MRIRTLSRTLLLVASLAPFPAAVWAQPPQTPPPATSPAAPQGGTGAEGGTVYGFRGTLDIGGAFSSTDGDEARFERYTDRRSGLFSSLTLNRDRDDYLFDASANHVGYRDQRYRAKFRGSRFDFNAAFTSNPLNFSYLTRTPFVTDGSTLTLDDAAQRAVQGATISTTDGVVGVPCAPGGPPASCSNATLAAQAKANRSIYNGLASQFDLRYTRHIASADVRFDATRHVDVDASFMSTQRSGAQPWGASFAFNNAVEIPKPLDERTNDFRLGANWANDQSSFRVGWDGSWFNNQFHNLVWDNPIFFTDYNNGLLPPNGPYDPNGYSNGNGPGRGREATAPDNHMQVFSAVGVHKLGRRTTVNGTAQFTTQQQNETLIPWTINSVIIDNPVVLAAFPHLAQNPRATAEAKAVGVNTLLNFASRPYRRVGFNVRYRFNKRDVQTPIFDATEYVRFDAVPEEIEEGLSPQFDNSRHYLDANVSYTPSRFGTVRIGYGFEGITRSGRGFADVGEHIFRASYDVYSNRWVTVRGSFDASRRRGEGFVDAASGAEDTDIPVGPGGTQPTLRYYDEADRNRTRGMATITFMPRDNFDVFFQAMGGKDTFLADDFAQVSRPGEYFGLLEQTNGSWNIGFNFRPTETLSAGANFGRDTFGSFQRSRNANPPPDPTWTDPARDWTLDIDAKIEIASVYLDLVRAVRNTDIRFGYDFNDSDNSFVHGGPRIVTLAAAGQFIPLPNVTNTWHRAMVDVQHYLRPRIGVAVGYYLEKLDVVDFNTLDTNGPVPFAGETGDPRLDWLGGLTTGYGNRPFKGQTGYVRLLYKF